MKSKRWVVEDCVGLPAGPYRAQFEQESIAFTFKVCGIEDEILTNACKSLIMFGWSTSSFGGRFNSSSQSLC